MTSYSYQPITWLTLILLMLSGCAAGPNDVDVNQYEPDCVQNQCTVCAPPTVTIAAGFELESYQTCTKLYKVCVENCPLKNLPIIQIK
jgi:hypothetical protein